MNKSRFFMLSIIIFTILTSVIRVTDNVFADMGSKPSITVIANNINTTNYLVDLFVKAPEKYTENMDCNCEASQEQIKQLYDLNYDGWISESTRWSAFYLMSDINGNDSYTNTFTYFGVPNEYRVVIINNDTGETKISEVLTRQNFNERTHVDYKSMDVIAGRDIGRFIISALIALVLTILVELAIAFFMKIKKWPIIIITNILTNVSLQILFFTIPANYWIIFGIGELAVLLVESITYCNLMKGIDRKKILLYTFVANLATALLTLLISRIF